MDVGVADAQSRYWCSLQLGRLMTERWLPRGPTGPVSHHLTGRLSLVDDQSVTRFAQRTEQNNYGSEGWGFESLRAR